MLVITPAMVLYGKVADGIRCVFINSARYSVVKLPPRGPHVELL